MHLIAIPDMENPTYFNIWGKLTTQGQIHFWWNLDAMIQKLHLELTSKNEKSTASGTREDA